MNYTENYNLPQWEAGDQIKRSDMNDAMSAIDAAIPRITYGYYTGNAPYTNGQYASQHITLGFRPKIVFVNWNGVDYMSGSYSSAMMLTEDHTMTFMGHILAEITDDGFTVGSFYADNYFRPPNINATGSRYYYVVIG